jgi:hypothetical protein
MISPAERPGFVLVMIVAFVVMALGVLGIVLLGRRRGPAARTAPVIAGMVGLSLLTLGSALTAFVIGVVLLANNR